MSEMIRCVLDCANAEGNMYQKAGESDAEYQARLARLRKKREERMTDEDRRLVAELAAGLENVPPVNVV